VALPYPHAAGVPVVLFAHRWPRSALTASALTASALTASALTASALTASALTASATRQQHVATSYS